MNYIDWFILVLLIWAIYKGFTRGLIMQLTVLIALGLGIFAAVKLSGFTAGQLDHRLNVSTETLYIIALGITFIIVFIGINLLGKVVEKFAEAIELSMINRLFGVLFSLLKTILLIGLFLTFIDRIDNKVHILPENTREHSLFYRPFTTMVKTIFPFLKTIEPDKGNLNFLV